MRNQLAGFGASYSGMGMAYRLPYNNPKLGGDDKPFKEKHTLRFDGKDISGHGNWINDIDDIGKKSEAPAEPKSIQASSNVSSNESSNTPDEITKALEKLNEITPNNIELPLVVIEGDEILVEGYPVKSLEVCSKA